MVLRHAMDLDTLRTRVQEDKYATASAVVDDVRSILSNVIRLRELSVCSHLYDLIWHQLLNDRSMTCFSQ